MRVEDLGLFLIGWLCPDSWHITATATLKRACFIYLFSPRAIRNSREWQGNKTQGSFPGQAAASTHGLPLGGESSVPSRFSHLSIGEYHGGD